MQNWMGLECPCDGIMEWAMMPTVIFHPFRIPFLYLLRGGGLKYHITFKATLGSNFKQAMTFWE